MKVEVCVGGIIVVAIVQFIIVMVVLNCGSTESTVRECSVHANVKNMKRSNSETMEGWAQGEHRVNQQFLQQTCKTNGEGSEPDDKAWYEHLYCYMLEPSRDSYSWLDWKSEFSSFSARWQAAVAPYLVLETHDVIQSRRDPPLQIQCDHPKLAHVLTGKKRAGGAVSVIDLFVLAHQIQVMELRMYELQGVVDRVVVLENAVSDRNIPKTLFYSRWEQRFVNFHDRIVHLLEDGRPYTKLHPKESENIYDIFRGNRDALLAYLKNAGGAPGDLWIYGEVEEIPRGELIHQLKHCELKPNVTPLRLEMAHHRGSFAFSKQETPWKGTFVGQIGDKFPNEIDFGAKVEVADGGWKLEQFGGVLATLYERIDDKEEPWSPGLGAAYYRDPWGVAKPYLQKSNMHKNSDAANRIDPKHERKLVASSRIRKVDLPWFVDANKKRCAIFRSKKLMISNRDFCADEGNPPVDFTVVTAGGSASRREKLGASRKQRPQNSKASKSFKERLEKYFASRKKRLDALKKRA